MNRALTLVLIILVALLYLKWILIALWYPFQAALYQYRKRGGWFWKLAGFPFWVWEKLCRGGWQRLSLYQIGLIPSNHLRKWLYKGLGVKCGRKSVIHFRAEIRAPYRLEIGPGSIIGDNALLDARNGLTIGCQVNLSSNVAIYTDQHDYRDPAFGTKGGPVTVGDRVWIGSNVVVLPGVTIGEGAVCCSGCVVTKDVEPYSVVAGIPAKNIAARPGDMRYELGGRSPRFY